MFKSFVFLFWVAMFVVAVVGVVWFYDASPQFKEFVDVIGADFARFFRDKIHL
jgi:hypothetical protein